MISSDNNNLNILKDFDEAFADAFPAFVADRHSKMDLQLNENEEKAFSSIDIEVIDDDTQVTRRQSSSFRNAHRVLYRIFHQNDERFSEL